MTNSKGNAKTDKKIATSTECFSQSNQIAANWAGLGHKSPCINCEKHPYECTIRNCKFYPNG